MYQITLKILSFLSNKSLYPIWLFMHKLSLALMWFWYRNNWEKNVINKLSKYYKWNFLFFDVWFNTWDYSKTVFDFFWSRVNIHWFEPVKKTYEYWLKNTGNLPNIKLNNFWLGNKESIEKIFFDNDLDWTASIVLSNDENDHSNVEEIKISTLDKYCIENKIDNINFLKIDVEWYEYNVLKWAETLLNSNKIDVIQFEFYKTNVFNKVFFYDFWLLLSWKYKFYRILNNWIYEIKNYSHIDCEIFIFTNYLLVRKNIDFSF